jgi:glutamate dehydrogenase
VKAEGLDPERHKIVTGLLGEAFTGEDHHESFVTAYFRHESADSLSACSNAELASQATEALSQAIVAAAQSWPDRVSELLPAHSIAAPTDAFPRSYQEHFAPAEAVDHLDRLSQLNRSPGMRLSLSVTPTAVRGDARGTLRAVAVSTQPLVLASVLPIFSHLGFDLVAEHPFTISPTDGSQSHVYEFEIQPRSADFHLNDDAAHRIAEAFEAANLGLTDSDALHSLVSTTSMTWKQLLVLRAYAAYLQQSGWAFSPDYVHHVIAHHPGIAQAIWELFEARLDVLTPRSADVDSMREAIQRDIDKVASIEADRILRMLLDTVAATTRTNAYRRLFADRQWTPDTALSFKLDPAAIRGLPKPVPTIEMWVFGNTVVGTHLRFGHVARGGIRWTDRRADFRTEVLGLVRAQMVKNAVIVPTGAKGVFYPRQLAKTNTPQERIEVGSAAYATFVESLLDLIDDLCKDEAGHYYIVPAEATARHDGDDTYLVLAADKGTAKFSDIANNIAIARNYWLGDAFASGGSNGYDHKGMGITARGAWESVRQHLFELGIDADSDPVTAVGIGDMSGDVFGNGMLRSRTLRLLAAFDHRHILIDPDPDPVASVNERQRLYDQPGSSWADYRPEVMSAGGAVYPRSAKSVTLHPAARSALALDPGTAEYTPDELIRAVLKAPVDLLFNGGIGTYVRATSETNSDVGDSANDTVRITSDQLRASVIGEGGNLGLTPMARREAAQHGVRLNADAIDNAAGVDTSDHEVNIKIALKDAIAAGLLAPDDRNELLRSLTDDIAARVLANNRTQNNVLSVARSEAVEMAPVHRRMLTALEGRGLLHRAVESMPSDAELQQRISNGGTLTSPELGTLLAYVKLDLKAKILESDIPDEAWAAAYRQEYFPAPVLAVCGQRIADHPLAREITAAVITNRLVDDNGLTFVHRMQEETGAPIATIVRAWAAIRECSDQVAFLREIRTLPSSVTMPTRTKMQLRHRRMVERSVRWLLSARRQHIAVDTVVAEFGPPVAALRAALPGLLEGTERTKVDNRIQRYIEEHRLPEQLARRCATPFYEVSLFTVGEIARQSGHELRAVAHAYFSVAARLRLDDTLRRIAALRRSDNWDAMSRAVLRDDLYTAVADLTRKVVATRAAPSVVQAAINESAGAGWMDGLVNAAVDPSRDPDLPILLVAAEAAKSFAASLELTAVRATAANEPILG